MLRGRVEHALDGMPEGYLMGGRYSPLVRQLGQGWAAMDSGVDYFDSTYYRMLAYLLLVLVMICTDTLVLVLGNGKGVKLNMTCSDCDEKYDKRCVTSLSYN